MSWAAVLGAGINATSDMVTNIWNQVNQNRAWRREDTAIQRRVADLKAAGLSPVLAAGQAAQSQGPITHKPAHFDLGAVLEATRLKMDKQKNDAEINNIKADTQTKEIENRARGRSLLLEQAMQEERLKQMEVELRISGIEEGTRRLEQEMKQFDVNHLDIELVRRTLQNNELYNTLSIQEKDYVLKEIAIELAILDGTIRKRHGITPGMSLPLQLQSTIFEQLQRIFPWIKKERVNPGGRSAGR